MTFSFRKLLEMEAIENLDLRTRKKRFVVLPGYVQSAYDGQTHYIDAVEIMRLYHVPSFQCIIVDRRRPGAEVDLHWALRDLIKLSPRQSGNYRLPVSARTR